MNPNFNQYHADNPMVYELILKYARQAKRAGHAHYSLRAILHRIRWHMNVQTKDNQGFQINNNYSQDYAMKVMEENPDLEGFFRLRF